jgi:hypothetical protein
MEIVVNAIWAIVVGALLYLADKHLARFKMPTSDLEAKVTAVVASQKKMQGQLNNLSIQNGMKPASDD